MCTVENRKNTHKQRASLKVKKLKSKFTLVWISLIILLTNGPSIPETVYYFHLYGESSFSGEKSNRILLPTRKFSEKIEYLGSMLGFITVPFCFFELLPCSSMKYYAVVLLGNEMELSFPIEFVFKWYILSCTIVFVEKLHCSKQIESTLYVIHNWLSFWGIFSS